MNKTHRRKGGFKGPPGNCGQQTAEAFIQTDKQNRNGTFESRQSHQLKRRQDSFPHPREEGAEAEDAHN